MARRIVQHEGVPHIREALMPESFKDLEDMLAASLDPRARERFGLPHPLHKFAAHGVVLDNVCADAILEFLNDQAFAEPDSMKHKAAMWFLLDSQVFFFACSECGIDADRFREHLRKHEERRHTLP